MLGILKSKSIHHNKQKRCGFQRQDILGTVNWAGVCLSYNSGTIVFMHFGVDPVNEIS